MLFLLDLPLIKVVDKVSLDAKDRLEVLAFCLHLLPMKKLV